MPLCTSIAVSTDAAAEASDAAAEASDAAAEASDAAATSITAITVHVQKRRVRPITEWGDPEGFMRPSVH